MTSYALYDFILFCLKILPLHICNLGFAKKAAALKLSNRNFGICTEARGGGEN